MVLEPKHDDVLVVLTTAPDLLLAKRIAHLLIEEKLAACINLGAPVLSVYGWDGDVQAAEEIPMTIKTTRLVQARLVQRIAELHPYDVPEVIVLPVIDGYRPYVDWVIEATSPSAEPKAAT